MIIGIAAVVFMLLLLPIGAYTIVMSLRYALALPACVVENTKARPSLRRAIDLSKGARGRIFGQLGPGMTAVSQVIGFFTNTFLGPIWATGVTLLYYDQRVRKEGFDIEWMMQAAGLTMPAPAPQIEAESTGPTSENPAAFTNETPTEMASPAASDALADPPPIADPHPEPKDPELPHE